MLRSDSESGSVLTCSSNIINKSKNFSDEFGVCLKMKPAHCLIKNRTTDKKRVLVARLQDETSSVEATLDGGCFDPVLDQVSL